MWMTGARRILCAGVLSAGVLAASPAQSAATAAAPVAAGEVAPDFALTDQNGGRHVLSGERGKRIVVLVFYRGHW